MSTFKVKFALRCGIFPISAKIKNRQKITNVSTKNIFMNVYYCFFYVKRTYSRNGVIYSEYACITKNIIVTFAATSLMLGAVDTGASSTPTILWCAHRSCRSYCSCCCGCEGAREDS